VGVSGIAARVERAARADARGLWQAQKNYGATYRSVQKPARGTTGATPCTLPRHLCSASMENLCRTTDPFAASASGGPLPSAKQSALR